MRRAAAIAFLCAGALGCGAERTEVVLTVSAPDLVIGTDIDSLHIVVTDTTAPNQALADRPVALCGAGANAPTCKQLPVTATLIPGPSGTNDPVRVLVEGTLAGTPVISDAAVFTFVPGESGELDFVLYARCKGNISCSLQDKVCDIDGNCTTLKPVPLGADLSGVPPPDLSTTDQAAVLDFSASGPHDLSTGGNDLLPLPPDMASHDLAGCITACGGLNVCGPDPNGCLALCGVCSSGVCQSNRCVPCGQSQGQPCCPGSMCPALGLACSGGFCEACGNPTEPCCPGGMCSPNPVGNHCLAGTCTTCGVPSGACCNVPPALYPCQPTFACDSMLCEPCGGPFQVCCVVPQSALPCMGGLQCDSGSNKCLPPDMAMSNRDMAQSFDFGAGTGGCGVKPGDPCCQPGNTCGPGLVCVGGISCEKSD